MKEETKHASMPHHLQDHLNSDEEEDENEDEEGQQCEEGEYTFENGAIYCG